MTIEVIRIIKYSGTDDAAIRKCLGMSLNDGIKELPGYSITISTHSSNLDPAVALSDEEVKSTLEKVIK